MTFTGSGTTTVSVSPLSTSIRTRTRATVPTTLQFAGNLPGDYMRLGDLRKSKSCTACSG